MPSENLRVLSRVEGLTALSEIEGLVEMATVGLWPTFSISAVEAFDLGIKLT